MDVFDALVEDYPAWWIDFLGEHNHVGGIETTRWLLERSRLKPGDPMLDCGAFVGASARFAHEEAGARPVAIDLNADFLRAGRSMPGGDAVAWAAASTHRLPFRDRTFRSVWCLDAYVAPTEMTRVAAAHAATVCLCGEVPVDGRGGVEAFMDEWRDLGWQVAAHKPLTLEALQAWRNAEAFMVSRRSKYEQRYGTRGYLAQLDLLGELVRSYERGEMGHALFVFAR